MIRPPRVAEALLRRCLPPGAKGLAILGDLREEFRSRVDRGTRANWWYWREALLLSLRYLTTRGPRHGERRWGAWLPGNDLRMAVRTILRDPAMSGIIVLTLGVAIAASTIGFTFADLALLRGLPIADPDRVVSVYGIDARQSDGRARLSLANYRDLRASLTTIEHFAGYQPGTATLIDRGIPISLGVTRVTPEFFDVVRMGAAAGRVFRAGDDQPGQLAVVLAHHYWRRVHEASPAVLGRTMLIDGRSHVVVGVASPAIEFGNMATANLWVPLEIAVDASRTDRVLTTMARLRDGVSLESAQAEVSAVGHAIAATHPTENRDWKPIVLPISEVAFGRGFWVIIALFIAAVVLLMVIASANAASLVLARALSRRREIALRSALGAGRWRLLRQALVEGLLLSTVSAALAVPIAVAALRVIQSIDSEPAIQQLALDGHEFGFIGLIALLTPILFAVLPTLSAARLDLRSALQSGGARLTSGASRGRTVLVAVQLSLAVTLLTTAGLAVRTGINLSQIDYGMRTADALVFGMNLDDRQTRIGDPRSFLEVVRAHLQRLPGVEAVHAFQSLPVLTGERLITLEVEGQSPTIDPRPWAFANAADAGALGAMRVPLISGRWITEPEEREHAPVVVISETAARMYFGSPREALGRRITPVADGPAQALEVVGVVADVLVNDVERGAVPRLWLALGNTRQLDVVVTTRGPQPDLAASVRREMAAIAPTIPLEQLETIEYAFTRFQASNQVVIGIFAGFAVVAVLLAVAGLYGLITYTVGLRIPEFGTRFAFGARPIDVLALVFRQVGRLTGVALGIGLLAGLAAGQGMRGVLYGVSPTDPITIGAVIGLIALVAIIASIRPAVRAASLSLIDALRAE
jgi:putative ABC transport system permease protein